MGLVSLQIRGSVARYGIFGLKWRYYGPIRIFWTIGEYSYLLLYPLIIYTGINGI